MGEIRYSQKKNLTKEEIIPLFESVKWESANYPIRLTKAINNSQQLITAWDEEKLIGLINGIDDGELTAYIHYLLVDPAYQGTGIGKELTNRLMKMYKGYRYVLLIAETKALIGYYESLGFSKKEGQYPMAVFNGENQQ